MSTDAQKIHFIWHWPHGDVLSDLKITRTPGMAPVEDGTARFLELLEAISFLILDKSLWFCVLIGDNAAERCSAMAGQHARLILFMSGLVGDCVLEVQNVSY
ncbi:hypothetical protein Q3G72_005272 [Acer saccharum]|nr:hypothetical protein Q3G72_005272 [Acer saccharum]